MTVAVASVEITVPSLIVIILAEKTDKVILAEKTGKIILAEKTDEIILAEKKNRQDNIN